MTSDRDELIGTVIADRYRVDELLGEGGMGKVYAAEHTLIKKRVAIKALRRELSTLPDIVARFEREALATARVDHPNIAAATDFGRLPDGTLFLVLELVKGTSLRDEIESGPLAVERALHIARQIAGALAAAHALDIVHRDLKPENVMLVTRGADRDIVKVLDFGIAKIRMALMQSGDASSAPLTKAGEVFGTPEYMAPEQALGQEVDGRADLYSLGAILYEMLCGERPFSSKTDVGVLAQKLAHPVPLMSERVPAIRVAPRVEAFVMDLLAKEVASRFQTAEETAAVLDDLLRPAPDSLVPPPVAEAPEPAAPKTAFLGTAAQVYADRVPEAPRLPDPQVAPQPPPVSAPAVAEPVAARVEPAVPRGPSRFSRALALTRRALGIACEGLDATRPRWPVRVQNLTRKIPAGVMVGVGMCIWVAMLWTSMSWVRGRPAESKEPQRSEQAVVEAPKADPVLAELEQAKKEGHAALVKLSERHPKSGPVWAELGLSSAAKSDHDAAITAIAKALELEPKLNEKQSIADELATAVRRRSTQDAAFNLLSSKMGGLGAGVIYDLSFDQKVPASLRSRSEQWVRSPSFEKVALPGDRVAAGLRYAKSCSARYDLLSQAREVGGQRTLAYLKIMRVRQGCGRRGRDDCFSCLRKDESLADAIAAVEKRVAEKSQKP